MKEIIKLLKQIGLSEKESLIYLALIEIGRGTAYKIAQRSGLKRPTVYSLLDELRKKGIIMKIPHKKNQIFIAKDPAELFDTFEENLYRAKARLPELIQKMPKENLGVKTIMFEGKNDVEKSLAYKRDSLKNDFLLAFYGVPSKGKVVPEAYFKHAEILKNQKTKVRAIISDDKSLDKFKEKYEQDFIVLSNKEYSPNVSIEVGSNISKIFLHTKLQTLIVEGKEFSDFLKQIFEIVWKSKSKYPLDN